MKDARARLRCRSGILLPIALFLVLALCAMATSVLVLARNELLLERGDLTYVENRIGAEGSFWPDSGPIPDSIGIPLGSGFVLVPSIGSAAAAESGEMTPATIGLVWHLDPDSVAADLPGALEVGHSPPQRGVLWPEPECQAGGWSSPIRVRADAAPPADPPLPLPPRIGMLGIDRLLGLPRTSVDASGALPHLLSPGIFEVPPETVISSGDATGILVAPGDLALSDSVRFRGLVLVAGDLSMTGHSRVEGVVLAGGTAGLYDDSAILGCPAAAGAALDRPETARSYLVPGGRILGRF